MLYIEMESFAAATVALEQAAKLCEGSPTGQRMVDALADFNRALAISRAFEARDVPSLLKRQAG
jgi:hypothetical protein